MHDGSNAFDNTIAAIATPAGQGGVGIIRISGRLVPEMCLSLFGKALSPRHAHYYPFLGSSGEILDYGIGLYFPAPHSFTGEHVLELQGHGGPVVLDMILERCLELGASLAKPGEFSERAFLNGKLDLAQAEAVADLISSSTRMAAKSALNSLKGEFSNIIDELSKQLIQVRMYVESAIDFPDEEIDLLDSSQLKAQINTIIEQLKKVLSHAQIGVRLKEGLKVAIVGEPNVGKSSLLNALCEQDIAIVSSIPGTTRDIVKENIHIDGVPIELIDTAGIRLTSDEIESEGIKRARDKLSTADAVIWVNLNDEMNLPDALNGVFEGTQARILKVINKIDISNQLAGFKDEKLYLSAKTGEGIVELRQYLKKLIGIETFGEGVFIARRRHVNAINQSLNHSCSALLGLNEFKGSECVAEELRLAHLALCEITGAFSADDLLGKIFSEFCIGK